MQRSNLFFLLGSCLVLVLFIQSCATIGPKKLSRNIHKKIAASEIFDQYFLGFYLYDLSTKEVLYQKNADRYFTPASNTKLFTFYAGLKILGDSVPALKYIVKNDSLIFWGTGDPSLLHPDTLTSPTLTFLKNRSEKLYYSDKNYAGTKFGPGWAWDDYNDSYSAEITTLPIFGNLVRFDASGNKELPKTFPHYFEDSLQVFTSYTTNGNLIQREVDGNQFTYFVLKDSIEKQLKIPFKYQPEIITSFLADTLEKNISYASLPFDTLSHTLYGGSMDSLFKKMLHVSDNFIAEQILMMCSQQTLDTMDLKGIIKFVKENYLADLPDEPIWVDGSGLSRYNLFTPRTIAGLLEKIYQEMPQPRLFELMPHGGDQGTLENWYLAGKPYVFAKTGTLRHNHCLSGYLLTDSGKTLIFSFMHNNYPFSSSITKPEMETILRYVSEHY
ncbi:D-alanyl-D-alanine carboxypeptidase [Fulvivirgaceae bacterium BMA10]|uniref:D-alanyl-D-alanine carboxypeptidase n=1 Tax=Splendidivirga corallicola TaxID=3051826 RepID=A0ABT8KNJ5_9BACT|nr:D-alanyl-D-alanine carboxypeptidase [Fulvivirgaceae bacterium BMA10]